ncbi:hypothetical protein JHN59_07950 [Streptomyces sp. MBT49]|uniref:hypothetical protein n=1 Tax=Streptomyces sp. MBT49 TaxID=1488380 RepID=UPI00190997A7|nr:hypothetical protein [Streptomyces sp. MBT49]MBK3624782.1 hypothetical protein [Streptomyces sp. MBT49]
MRDRVRARRLIGLAAITALLALAPIGVAAADSEDASTVTTVSRDTSEQPTDTADISVERLLADISW